MDFEVGKYYWMRLNLGGREIEYFGKVVGIFDSEFRFETNDDYACRALTLRKKDVLSFREMNEPSRERKIYNVSNKKKFDNLKPADLPEF